MKDQAQNLRNSVKNTKQKTQRISENNAIKIYCVASGKGGVGKTNTVVNLAISLQQKGKKVLIIDADLGMANIDVLLDIYPEVTLLDVLMNNKPLKDAVINGPKGIKIISGGSGMSKMTALDMVQQRNLADEFLQLKDIDTILIDTGAGISMNLMSFLAFSQEILIVTTPEPTSLTDAYGLLKVISQLNLDRKINVIVNRAPDEETALLTFDRLHNAVYKFLKLELEYLGYIMNDIRVTHSVMDRRPLILEYPNSIASKCLMAITNKMTGESNGEIKLSSMAEVYNRLIKVFG